MKQAYADLLATLGDKACTFDLLVDMSNSPIQPAEVVRNLSDFVAQKEYRPARMAFVHGDGAVKMQARRVSGEHDGRHFATMDEAMAWFMTDRPEAEP